jgi:hypothetical protein
MTTNVPRQRKPLAPWRIELSKAQLVWCSTGGPPQCSEYIWQCSGLSDARRWGRLIRHERHQKGAANCGGPPAGENFFGMKTSPGKRDVSLNSAGGYCDTLTGRMWAMAPIATLW